MSYLEQQTNKSPYLSSQQGSSENNNLLNSVNLYSSTIEYPLALATLEGRDGLSISLLANYRSTLKNTATKKNKYTSDSVLGFGWAFPLEKITIINKNVKQSYHSGFMLTGKGGEYPLYRVGKKGNAIMFLSIENPIWEFLFYESEKNSYWKITKEDGSSWIYGGSTDNIAMAISWDNWVGPTTSNGGEQFPVCWYLSEIRSYGGSTIEYKYDHAMIPIGNSSYTRTIRLAKLISTYGEEIHLKYRPKEPFEYELPHQTKANHTAYQFMLEDHYLESVDVYDNNQQLKYKQLLRYELKSQDGTDHTKKRFLTTVEQIPSNNIPIQPLHISYDLNNDSPTFGTLIQINYPTGYKHLFNYTIKELSSGACKMNISPPDNNWETKLIHNQDYILIVFTRNKEIRVRVYFWDIGWQVFEDNSFKSEEISETALYTGNGFFAVGYYSLYKRQYYVRLFKRCPVRKWEWEIKDILLKNEQKMPAMACGMDFFAVQCRSNNTLLINQFNYTDNKWHEYNLPVESFDNQAIGAGKGFIMGAYHRKGGSMRLRSFYADENHVWKNGDYKDLHVDVNWDLTNSSTVWAIGDSQAAATFTSIKSSEQITATVVLIRWRDRFKFAETHIQTVIQQFDIYNPILYSVATDTLIGFAQNVFRYSPGNWHYTEILKPTLNNEYRYAYGSDLVLAVEKKGNLQKFYSIRFDPFVNNWVKEGCPVSEEVNSKFLCIPLIAGNIAILGKKIFMCDNQSHWNLIGYLPEYTDFSSVRIDPEGGYLLFQSASDHMSYMLPIKNDKAGKMLELNGQCCNIDDSWLAGANAFCTFTPDAKGNIHTLSLYSIYEKEFIPKRSVQVVDHAILDTGFSKHAFYFDYDLDSARIDGDWPAFQRVKIIPHSREAKYGYTETTYFNGLPPEHPKADYPLDDEYSNARNFYTHFAGKQSYTRVFDDQKNPVSGDYIRMKAMDMHAFCICQTKIAKQKWLKEFSTENNSEKTHVIEEITTFTYEPRFYLTRSSISHTKDNKGNPVQTSQTITYAWEKYPALLEAHNLSPVVHTMKKEDISNTIIEAETTLWEECEDKLWREKGKYTWDGTSSAEFPEPGAKNWINTALVIQRDHLGQVICQSDETRRIQTTLYDKQNNFIVAQFEDAYAEEVVYCGFEPYEKINHWTNEELLTPLLSDEEYISGTRSLKLSQGQSVSFNLECNREIEHYFLKFALKSKSEIAVRLTITENEKINKKEFIIQSTGGIWKDMFQTFEIPPGCNKKEIYLEMIAPKNDTAFIDTLFFTPIQCGATSYVYMPDLLLQTASHSNRAPGIHTYYDQLQRPVSTTNETFPASLAWKIYNANSAERLPDETISLEFPDINGSYYTFNRGLDFTEVWHISGNYSIRKGILNGQEAKISLKKQTASSFGFFFTVTELRASFILELDNIEIKFVNNKWQLVENGKVRSEKICNNTYENFLLLCIDGRLQFYKGNDRIFSEQLVITGSTPLSVSFLSPFKIGLLAYCPNPQIKISYTDYSGRPIQDQAVTEKGVVIGQVLYNDLQQASVTTKQLEIKDIIWGFRSDFVTSFDWVSGIMKGEICDAFPMDEGYSYTRNRFTQSPDPSPLELGQPGKERSITKDNNPNTSKFMQCANGKLPVDLPVGQYYTDIVMDPDGLKTINIKDTSGNDIAKIKTSSDNSELQATLFEYDCAGRLIKKYYPNHNNDEHNAANFSYDPAGYLAVQVEPDSGTSRLVHDKYGKLRFSQDADGANEGYYAYIIYDKKGRETESGLCKGLWDETSLRKLAEKSDSKPTGSTWRKKIIYDSNGNDPRLLGRIWQVIIDNNGELVTDFFTYDAYGNIIRHTREMTGYTENVNYKYDHKNKLLSVYTDDKKVLIDYTYDIQGRMTAVLWQGEKVCSYTYSPSGSLETETFAPEKAGKIVRNYEYNQAEWLISLKDRYFSQQLLYESSAGKKKYNGKICGSVSSFQHIEAKNILRSVEMEYEYDGLGRLKSALCKNKPQYSIGIDKPCSYDANGNLLRMDHNVYNYGKGNNRLYAVNQSSYSYNGNGAVNSAKSVGIENIQYDKFFNTVDNITIDADERLYIQGSDGVAVMKNKKGTTYSINDINGHLLWEVLPNGERVVCLHGVNGIFAQVTNEKVYYLLKDYQASVRAIYDGNDICSAYNYLPFGGLMGAAWERAGIEMLIPLGFTTQRRESQSLYRLKNRWYDTYSGRFLSIDPECQYPSPYIYGGCDWINYFDPDGAWSWGSFFAIIGGIALVGVGIALTIASGGIASPVGAFFATLGTTAIVGAGIAATIYGITSWINKNFSWKDLLIQMGAGAVFGMVGAGLGYVAAGVFTAGTISAFVVDVGIGVLVGSADGMVTNGFLNVAHGGEFTDHLVTNLIVGGITGGVMSGISGLGHAFRNVKSTRASNSTFEVIVAKMDCDGCVNHSSIWSRGNGTTRGSDLVGPSRKFKGILTGEQGEIRALTNINHHNYDKAIFKVSRSQFNKLNAKLPAAGTKYGRFNYVTNSCSGYVIKQLHVADIHAPIWARSPNVLQWWAKMMSRH